VDSPTEPNVTPKVTRWYACVRCGHQVAEGGGEVAALRWTASPTVLFGQCQNCITVHREALRQKPEKGTRRILPPDGPTAFRLVLP